MDDNGDTPDTTPESVQQVDRKPLIWMIVGAVVVLLLAIFYVWAVSYKPAYSANKSAGSAVKCASSGCSVHLAIQQTVGLGPHADWLGYQTDVGGAPHPGTIMTLPRNTLVTFTIRNFDSATALRNPFFTLVQGTIGNVEYVSGKKLRVMNPDLTSHTFTIPDFGVSVPMRGIPDSGNPSFETMKFTIRTPNRKGTFSWQCIVPCGSGLYGNGGPMSELGYMQGLITLK